MQRSCADVAPRTSRRREAFAQHHRAAAHQRGPGGHHAADAVVQRQAVVHAVARCHVHHSREPVAPLHQAVMADVGGFGQPGGAGGVDAQRALIAASGCGNSPGSAHRAETAAAMARSRRGSPAVPGAMHPAAHTAA